MDEEFDELYVVSDLHLGGETGFQIFGQGPLLARLIQHVRDRERKKVGLLLNGDTVDFLSEQPASYLDVKHAAEKLLRVRKDAAFAPVFDALTSLVHTEGRRLILVLGNHDVELALPAVQRALVDELCGDDDAARGRLRFCFDGTGCRCRVGKRNVLCVHGNVDAVNVVDHNALRKTVRALNRGQEPEPWKPNFGSKLVVDVMNGIKREHPFIDVLKPEGKAAIPILLAIDPAQSSKIDGVFRCFVNGVRDWMRLPVMGEELPEQTPGARTEGVDSLLLGTFSGFSGSARPSGRTEDLLHEVEREVERGTDPVHLVSDETGAEVLSLGASFWQWLRGNPTDALREALEAFLRHDRSFDEQEPDVPSCWAEENVGSEIDYVIAGHTHLARAIRRRNGAYFNCGTWAYLIEMDVEMTRKGAFEAIYEPLKRMSIKELREAKLIKHRPTVVYIGKDGSGRVTGELREARAEAGGTTLVRVSGTEPM